MDQIVNLAMFTMDRIVTQSSRRVVPTDIGLFMSVIVWSTYALPVHVLFCGN